ncbi:SER2 [Candida oxycetoniae]|uniref:phosphoserine phosphatase n=1 Tax=Candida oxycetoniae TaxID=497107 RepID=A0AAI9SXH7_9ASCO|nr:SER2 [Candida oxycetoniae]KAI3404385.2 SER2 [Candida oxycetoniae]
MQQCVITAISHLDILSNDTLQKIEQFVKETLGVDSSTIDIKQLSPRAYDYFVEISDLDKCRELVKTQCLKQDYDLIIQAVSTRQNKKLFVFDMDSTLIYQEVIELIAAYAGIQDKVAEITNRAMNGEIDFNESLKERVGLLRGINSTTIWRELEQKIEITNGVKPLTKALKNMGCTLAVCSGGFIPLAEHIKEQLGLDYAFANKLSVDDDNILNGETVGEIVNGERKAELLLEIAQKHNISPANAVAIGDGANDLKMMSVAGFGIAWNAKPKVQLLAPACLNTTSLLDVLYIMGHTDEQIKTLIE